MGYDLQGARAAGISDAQSAEYLAHEFDYDLGGALNAGFGYDDILSALLERAELGKPTVAGRLKEFGKGIPRGFIHGFGLGLEGIGDVANQVTDAIGLEDLIDEGEDNELIRFGNVLKDSAETAFGADPAYRDLWTTKAGDALGSLSSFLVPGSAAKLLGATSKLAQYGPTVGLAVGVGAGEQYERRELAKEQGLEISEGRELLSSLTGSLIGLSEMAPVAKILKGLPPEVLKMPFMQSFWPRLSSALGSGAVEGIQEVTAGLLQDVTERGLYNPNAQIGQTAWDELTLGGFAGFTADLLLNAIVGRRARGLTAQEVEHEKKNRREEADRLRKSLTPEDLTTIPLPEADPNDPLAVPRGLASRYEAEMGDNFPLNVQFAPDGNFVRDQDGNQYGPEFEDGTQAQSFATAMNETVANRALEQRVDLAIDQSPVSYSSRDRGVLHMLGRRLLHPRESRVTAKLLNAAGETVLEKGYAHEAMSAQEALDNGIKLKDMTLTQRINARRLKKGLSEMNHFSLAEAKAALGDKFANLANYSYVPIAPDEKFRAFKGKKKKNPYVKSSLGEVIRYYTDPKTGKRRKFKDFDEAKNYAAYLTGRKGEVLLRTDIKPDDQITTKDIERILKEKNITSGVDSLEVRALAEVVTGVKARGKTKVADMSDGERAVLYYKLRSLPKLDQPAQLPVFGLRPYSPAAYRSAYNLSLERLSDPTIQLGAVTAPAKAEIEAQSEPMSDAVYKRLMSDLYKDQALKEEINKARRRPEEAQIVLDAIKDNLTRYGMGRVGTRVMDLIRKVYQSPQGDMVEGRTIGDLAAEGAYNPALDEIFFAIDALKANPEFQAVINESQEVQDAKLAELAVETLNHEVIHAMRKADLFTEQEWEYLKSRAERTVKPGLKDKDGKPLSLTYRAWAEQAYPDAKSYDDMIEEAVAEMVRDSMSTGPNRLQLPPRQKSLFRRIVEFLRGIVGIQSKTGYRSLEDIVGAIQSGEIGGRKRGEVRTMRATTRAASRALHDMQKMAEAVEEGVAGEEGAEVEEFDPTQDQGTRLAGQSRGDFEMFSVRSNAAKYTRKRMNRLLSEFGYPNGRVVAAVVEINPSKFIDATTASERGRQAVRESVTELDTKRLAKALITPFVKIKPEGDDWRITGHEGRHRMEALARAGVTSAPLVVINQSVPYDNESLGLPEYGYLKGQEFNERNYDILSFSDPVDISYDNRGELSYKYGDREQRGIDDVSYSRRMPIEQFSRRAPLDPQVRAERIRAMKMRVDAYHGSMANIERFNGEVTGSQEGYYGAHNYFTTTPEDVENYAGWGPDRTSRRDRLTEDLEGRREFGEIDDADVAEHFENVHGLKIGEPTEEQVDQYIEEVVIRDLGVENEGVVYPVKLRDDNLVRVGTSDETFFEYEYEIDEDAGDVEVSGDGERLYEAAAETLNAWTYDEALVEELLSEVQMQMMDDGGISAEDFEDLIRMSGIEFYHPSTEEYSGPGPVIADIYAEMGYDGVKMNAWKKFGPQEINLGYGKTRIGGMKGIDYDTRHYIIFNHRANRIRSRYADFNPARETDDDITASRRLDQPLQTTIADSRLTPEQRKLTNLDRRDPVTGEFIETAKPNKTLLVDAAQQFFDERGGVVIDASDPNNVELLATLFASELEAALHLDKDAIDWYGRTLHTAKRMVSLIHPEVMKGRKGYSAVAEHALDLATAVTSNGMGVIPNFKAANEQYNHWKRTGRFIEKGYGQQAGSMVPAFQFYNAMRDNGYSDRQIKDFLEREFTPSELRQDPIVREVGATISGDEFAHIPVHGSYVFGPKIGEGFYRNLRGYHDSLTMDIWWMRMFNRLTGHPYKMVSDELLAKNAATMRRVIANPESDYARQVVETAKESIGFDADTDQALLDLAVEVDRIYQRDYGSAYRRALADLKAQGLDIRDEAVKVQARAARPVKTKTFKQAGTTRKNYERQLQDAPRGPGDRLNMRRVTRRAAQIIKSDLGLDVELSDIQAVMWYAEKRLFAKAGVRKGAGDDNDYIDGAIALLREEGISDERIEDTLPPAERYRVAPDRYVKGRNRPVRQKPRTPDRKTGRKTDETSFSRRIEGRRNVDPEAAAEVVAENTSEAMKPGHEVPYYSHLASPEAQYIARHPEAALSADDELALSVRPASLTPQGQAAVSAVGGVRPTARSPFHYYQLATTSTEKPSFLRYLMTKAKQEAINRYARLERLHVTTDLRNNLADASSLGAMLHQDRAVAIVAAAIHYGTPAYANGMMMTVNKNTIPDLRKKNPQAADQLEQELRRQGLDPNTAKSLIDVMAPLYSKEHGNLTELAKAYAIAQRSKRLRKEGKKVPVTAQQTADIEAEVDRYTDANGDNPIHQWYGDWQVFNNHVITMMERAGILTDETAELWRNMADYYPFYRAAEGGGKQFIQAQKVFGGMTSAIAIKQLKGGEEAVNMEMVEAIVLNLSAAIQMSMKNVAQQRTVRDLIHLGLAETLRPGEQTLAPVVEFRVNGKKARAAIYDPLVYESMMPLEGTDVIQMIRKTFGMPATALRELVTRDPGFMLVNLMRDSLSSFVTSGAKLTPMVDTLRGLTHGVERLEKLGVVGGYDFSNDPDNIVEFWDKTVRREGLAPLGKMNSINMIKRVWDALGRGTTASDAATRNAVFDDVFARTGNIAESAHQAMEVINFGRRGRSVLARMLGAVVPFLNARFQGLDVFLRAFTGQYTANKAKNRMQVTMSAVTRASLLASMTGLYWMLMSDEEQYKQESDYVKDNNWLIPNPWGPTAFKIPIPFEVGLLFKTVPETILAATFGNKSMPEVRDTLVRGVGSTLEISPYSIQFAGPIMEAYTNYNSFTGRQVVPQYILDNIHSGLQAMPYSSEFAQSLGERFNISPMKIDHVMRGYIGTMGTYLYDLLDVALKDARIQGDNRSVLPSRRWWEYPVIKRFFAAEHGKGLQQDAYDLYREVEKVYNTMRDMQEKGDLNKLRAYVYDRQHLLGMRGQVTTIKEQLDLSRQQRYHIMRSDMPAELKRQIIDDIEEQTNAMLEVIIPHLKKVADMPFLDRTYR